MTGGRTSTSGLLLLLLGVLGLSLFLSPTGAWDRILAWLFGSGPTTAPTGSAGELPTHAGNRRG